LSSRLARLDRRIARRSGATRLAGVDEVGRGCLAGPVVVAAVSFPVGADLPGVDDSKRLGRSARERLYPQILELADDWSAICVRAEEVDRRNVLAASLWGMQQAILRLRYPPDLVLVDGNRVPEGLAARGVALVGGDGRSLCIAAASIVAKVLRDRVMRGWDRWFPGYGFSRNVGYPTSEHRQALIRLGPCPLHRRSFAPVASVLDRLSLRQDSASAR